MPATQRLLLIGGSGSPYTRKMLALLRYRHIPYRISWGDPASILDAMGVEKPRPVFLPTFLFEDGQGGIKAVCDSTPIIRHLESIHAERSVLPTDPALAFIDYLVEDFGDEWCTKYMFHYRWHFPGDADKAGSVLPLSGNVSLAADSLAQMKRIFSDHQVGRLYVVGSNDTTAPEREILLCMGS